MKIQAKQHKVHIYALLVHEGGDCGAFDEMALQLEVQKALDEIMAAHGWEQRHLALLSPAHCTMSRWFPRWGEDAEDCHELERCHSAREVRSKLPQWVRTVLEELDKRTFELARVEEA